jgi:hypothetical protein
MKKKLLVQKISLPPKLQKILIKEFNVSRQTIYVSLCYSNNSDTAKRIRFRAKELLLEEAKKITI